MYPCVEYPFVKILVCRILFDGIPFDGISVCKILFDQVPQPYILITYCLSELAHYPCIDTIDSIDMQISINVIRLYGLMIYYKLVLEKLVSIS